MSVKDDKLTLCTGTAVGTSIAAGVNLKGDIIDLGARRDFYDGSVTPNIGEAGDMWLNVKISTAFASAGSPAVTVALYHHTDASVASGAALVSATGIGTSAAGTTLIRQKLPAGTINRFLSMSTTIATAALTAGKIDAWISMDGETPK